MFQLHLTRSPWGWRWEPRQGCLTPQFSQATQPPPPTLVSGQLPLLSANPNTNPSSLHQQTCLLDSIT